MQVWRDDTSVPTFSPLRRSLPMTGRHTLRVTLLRVCDNVSRRAGGEDCHVRTRRSWSSCFDDNVLG